MLDKLISVLIIHTSVDKLLWSKRFNSKYRCNEMVLTIDDFYLSIQTHYTRILNNAKVNYFFTIKTHPKNVSWNISEQEEYYLLIKELVKEIDNQCNRGHQRDIVDPAIMEIMKVLVN